MKKCEELKVGVLALQGAFREHRLMIERLGSAAVEVRLPYQLENLDGLIIPGGESTAIGKLMVEWKLLEPIREMASGGFPLWGTCAGMIMMARKITERERVMDQHRLGLLDATVVRNAFGRQRESFETEIAVKGLDKTFHAIFIRAPFISDHGPTVEVLAEVDANPVFVRQGNLLGSSFHPELTEDTRIHAYFLDMIRSGGK